MDLERPGGGRQRKDGRGIKGGCRKSRGSGEEDRGSVGTGFVMLNGLYLLRVPLLSADHTIVGREGIAYEGLIWSTPAHGHDSGSGGEVAERCMCVTGVGERSASNNAKIMCLPTGPFLFKNPGTHLRFVTLCTCQCELELMVNLACNLAPAFKPQQAARIPPLYMKHRNTDSRLLNLALSTNVRFKAESISLWM